MKIVSQMKQWLIGLGILLTFIAYFMSITMLGLLIVGDVEAKVTAAMSAKVYKQLQAVQKRIEAEDFDQAMDKLIPLRKKEKLSNYERAQVWNLIGYVHYLKNNYKSAAHAYEQVLKQPELPPALKQSSLKTLSQLSLISENYKRAISAANQLLGTLDKPDANTLMVIGQAYYQLEQYQKAKAPTKRAIAVIKAAGRVPKENWLQLLNGIYHNTKDYRSMVGVLKELTRHYPKTQYFQMLAGVYSELNQTKKQLAITETLYEDGHLTRQTDLRNLATLYLLHKVPYKAAKLLEKETAEGKIENDLNTLKLLSQAWVQAGDDAKAIKPLLQAAKISGEEELYRRLGYAQFNLGNWKDAEKALINALNKGGLKDAGSTWLLLGMSRYRLKSLDKAKESFEKAAKHDRHKKVARQWIQFIELEENQRNELAAYNQKLQS